jgi:hypothetical protein
MKRFIASFLLSLLTIHFSASWVFGVGQVNAAAPETFADRCHLSVRCEKQPETQLIVCSREPLSIANPTADTAGKTAGGYHIFGGIPQVEMAHLQLFVLKEHTNLYHFEDAHF